MKKVLERLATVGITVKDGKISKSDLQKAIEVLASNDELQKEIERLSADGSTADEARDVLLETAAVSIDPMYLSEDAYDTASTMLDMLDPQLYTYVDLEVDDRTIHFVTKKSDIPNILEKLRAI